MMYILVGTVLTVRMEPALLLNLVAVTTLLFLGSTAPTATSGVSTTATSLGGAVSTAALPNSIGEPTRADGLIGVIGLAGLWVFKDNRALGPPEPPVDGGRGDAREDRRIGVVYEVEREREDPGL